LVQKKPARMKFIISKPSEKISGKVVLPSSKSISNRLLIIGALSGQAANLENLSESDDTLVMLRALQSIQKTRDIGHAGTAMRFLTAYFAAGDKEVILTGSERMKERPVGELVQALIKLGANIRYTEKKGFPPLKINGTRLNGGLLTIDGSISSQFISAILMIAPVFEKGLEIDIKGDIVSGAYIRMTLELMRRCGAKYSWSGNKIKVYSGNYIIGNYTVESDWSAASYWFAMVLLSDAASLELPFLFRESLQGDAVVSDIFDRLNIETGFRTDGISVTKREDGKLPDHMELDFTACPDLVQTMAPVLCAINVKFRFTGTKTLRIKETDRIAALQNELKKTGYVLHTDKGGTFLEWSGETCEKDILPEIETYHDHRMAMGFAPLALKFGSIVIKDPMVVTKSYPRFWDDLKQVGFSIQHID